MGYITVAFHATVLLHVAATSVYAQFMPQMPFAPHMPQVPQMPQMPGMALPQAVQTMQGQPMPMGMPMPGGMPMALQNMGMQQKMPVVMMPYHSKNQDKKSTKNRKKKKKRRPKKYTYKSESCSSEESGSSEYTDSSNERRSSRKRYMRSGHKSKDRSKHKRNREVLTPVISYVTKDGYVVYQKKVKKDKAKDWLDIGQKPPNTKWSDNEDSSVEKLVVGTSEEKIKDEVKRKYRKIMKKRD